MASSLEAFCRGVGGFISYRIMTYQLYDLLDLVSKGCDLSNYMIVTLILLCTIPPSHHRYAT